jgi:hypothetical protein
LTHLVDPLIRRVQPHEVAHGASLHSALLRREYLNLICLVCLIEEIAFVDVPSPVFKPAQVQHSHAHWCNLAQTVTVIDFSRIQFILVFWGPRTVTHEIHHVDQLIS